MNADETITLWIRDLKAGDEEAAARLWDRYFQRLVGLAAKKMSAQRRLAAEEDVALSAFKSLCLGAQQGRFPALSDRENLWPLLVVLTSRKASGRLRSERRLKRGGNLNRQAEWASDEPQHLDQMLGSEPTPEETAELAEESERLLKLLDEEARAIALAKLEGYTNLEIAGRTGLALRSVERKLQLIRRTWEAQSPDIP